MTYHHLHISLGARFLLEMGCDFLLIILCHVHDMKGPFSSNFQPMWVRFRGSKRAYLHGPQNQCNACQKSGLNFWGLWSTVLSPYFLLWDPCTSSKVRLASIQVSSKTRLTSWINKHFKAGHAHVSHQPSMPYKMLDVWTLQSSTCLESSSLLQLTGILASPLGVFSWLLAHQRPLLSSRVRAVTPVIQKGQHLWTQRGLRYCFFPVPEKGTGKAIVVEAVIS